MTIRFYSLYGAYELSVLVCIGVCHTSLIQVLVVLLLYGLPLSVLDECVVVLEIFDEVVKYLCD